MNTARKEKPSDVHMHAHRRAYSVSLNEGLHLDFNLNTTGQLELHERVNSLSS